MAATPRSVRVTIGIEVYRREAADEAQRTRDDELRARLRRTAAVLEAVLERLLATALEDGS